MPRQTLAVVALVILVPLAASGRGPSAPVFSSIAPRAPVIGGEKLLLNLLTARCHLKIGTTNRRR
jgi:hypothetical protein